MYWRFQNKLRRGFVLISTLFISTICIIIVLIVYKLELQGKNYASSYKKYILNEDINTKYKELVLTRLGKFIDLNIVPLNRENICIFFSAHEVNICTDDNKAKVVYDKERSCFIIRYYIDEYYHKEDIFDFKVENYKVYFTYKSSLYVEGRLI